MKSGYCFWIFLANSYKIGWLKGIQVTQTNVEFKMIVQIVVLNKKTFQLKANCPLANRCVEVSQVNKFEQIRAVGVRSHGIIGFGHMAYIL